MTGHNADATSVVSQWMGTTISFKKQKYVHLFTVLITKTEEASEGSIMTQMQSSKWIP